MTTIAELLTQDPIRTERGIGMLSGCYYNHLNGFIEQHTFSPYYWDPKFCPDISCHIFHEAICDVRRSWVIFGVKFKDDWVMLCRNAGRELDDYAHAKVLNEAAFLQMIGYINEAISEKERPDAVEISPMDEEVEFFFYGHDVRRPYDSWV